MMQFILSKWISKPIHVAAKLGIPDILAQKSRDIEELAKMIETLPYPLYRMMRALSGIMDQSGFRLSQIINTEENVSIIEGIPA
jgi:hypothetical protein